LPQGKPHNSGDPFRILGMKLNNTRHKTLVDRNQSFGADLLDAWH